MITLADPDLRKTRCHIDGQWYSETAEAWLDVNNPATGEEIALIPVVVAGETRGAIRAAAAVLGLGLRI